jgi:hypothetical protein
LSRGGRRNNTPVQNQNQTESEVIHINDNYSQIPNDITFNYSENFNRVNELTPENYMEWRTSILYLLCLNNLDIYVSKEKVNLLGKRDVKENIDDYISNKFDDSLAYAKDTSNQDI